MNSEEVLRLCRFYAIIHLKFGDVMKQSKLSFKTRRVILNIITVIFALAMILFYRFFTTTRLGVSIIISFLVIFCILLYFWWRCPHCDTFFGNCRGFQNIVHIVVMSWNNPWFLPVLF